MKFSFRPVVLACVLSLGAMACGGSPPAVSPTGVAALDDFNGAPAWIRTSCNRYWGDDAHGHVCAVGSVLGTGNLALARTAAAGRARTEIARVLETKVASLLKDYQRTVSGGEGFGVAASDEQLIQDTSKHLTDASLSGSAQIDTWRGPKSGTVYVLVELNPATFTDALAKLKSLDSKTREHVARTARKAFDELEGELAQARR